MLKMCGNHYHITDIILLADGFEKFRKMSLETYGLDPIRYYSLPGLSWDAMIRYTGVELELITDPDTHQMVEKSMRGVISNICHRYATSNHSSMDTYNGDEEPRIRCTHEQCQKCFLLEALNGYHLMMFIF